MENAGKRVIPAIEFQWFDIESKTLKSVKLPEVTFKVTLPAMGQSPGLLAGAKPFKILYVIGIVFIIIVGAVLWRWRRYLKGNFKSWQKYRTGTESAYFKRLIKACQKDDPLTALNELMRWLDRISDNNQTSTISDYLKHISDNELQKEFSSLQKAALQPKVQWSGASFALRLKNHCKQSWQPLSFKKSEPLPGLNPMM